MSDKLNNKISVITGAGSGIGKSIAKHFAQEKSKVYVFEIKEELGNATQKEILDSGGEVKFIHCDVADQKSVTEAVQQVLRNEDRIDILVNNAAISHVGNIEQTTTQDLDLLYSVNIKGVYLVTKEIIGPMVNNNGGVILNLASIVSKVGIAERFAYSMTKGAVLTMTLSIAKDYIDKNIRCNCICPARVHTPFVDDYLKKNYTGREQEVFEALSKFQPIGRMGQPEEIANLALFLCSDDSSFITAATYDIDGGVMNLR
jgi:NAD(P)-dependent dehydrogenase (short-subunit alcohol dehydrogenase family)